MLQNAELRFTEARSTILDYVKLEDRCNLVSSLLKICLQVLVGPKKKTRKTDISGYNYRLP